MTDAADAADGARPRALLVIGPEPPPATGMEIATQALLAELRRAQVRYVRVDTADPGDALGNRGHWTPHNVLLAFRHLADAVRKVARPGIGAVYIPIAQEFPALFRDLSFILIARMFRKPVIVHLHGGAFGDFFQSRSRPMRRLLTAAFGGVGLGIVLTERLRPALECILPPSRVVAVPNGVDLLEVPTVDEERLDDAITVLFLSSLFPSKGVLVFLEALAQARKHQPAIRGVVAGSWPSRELRGDILGLASDLALQDVVDFVGPVHGAEKTRLLRRADIFCFPSFYPLEGQPLVVIEAMAAGLPVVATAWRGIADTVVDGETGFLVDAPVPELVAEKLVYLADNREERRHMSASGRRRYEQLYTQRAFGERMVRALEPFLRDGRAAAPEATEA
jgi:glycosyltransferase involved in cell wall biosynthesis